MASADFCRLMLRHSLAPRFRLTQISPGKNADLHPMYLPHLPQCAPGSGRVSFCFANSPAHHGLICGFCSSGRDFAAGFLQIPPHDGHPCLGLILLAAKRIADSHRRVCARAGRTNKSRPKGECIPGGLFIERMYAWMLCPIKHLLACLCRPYCRRCQQVHRRQRPICARCLQ
jgi:hypothetical protein